MSNEKLAIEFLKILVSQGKIELVTDVCNQPICQTEVKIDMRTTLKANDLIGNTEVLWHAYNEIVSTLNSLNKD